MQHIQICPTSSVYTSSTAHDNHASVRLAKDGVSFSLSTDDPGVMLCDLNGEYVVAEENIGLTYEQLKLSVSVCLYCRLFAIHSLTHTHTHSHRC